MRIGIDAHLASSRFGGLGTYTVEIIRALSQLPSSEIVAFIPDESQPELELPHESRYFHIRRIPVGEDAPGHRFDYWAHWEQDVLPAQLGEGAVDVFFGPTYMAPLRWSGPVVVTVHDLIFERCPQYYSPDARQYYSMLGKRSAEKADAIIAVSHYTADELREVWGVVDKPVHIVYSAPALPFCPLSREQSRAVVSEALGLTDPYILYVGGANLRKNLGRLLYAYSLLQDDLRRAVRLVLLQARSRYVDLITERLGVTKRVVTVDYCEPDLMPHLYASAEVFVYPSLCEGFGLPPLEAMLCGIPVVASRVTSVPEIVADGALLIDPTHPQEIATAMHRALTDECLRSALVSRGRERALAFSWEKAAEQTYTVLGAVARE